MDHQKTELLTELFLRVINRYMATEKKPCDYGIGFLLYRSEVHTIDMIGKYHSLNITSLAGHLGITKSAASQMADKLVRKKLVIKKILSQSDTEVALTLTESGEKVYLGHMAYHQRLSDYMKTILSDVPQSDGEMMEDIFLKLYDFLND